MSTMSQDDPPQEETAEEFVAEPEAQSDAVHPTGKSESLTEEIVDEESSRPPQGI